MFSAHNCITSISVRSKASLNGMLCDYVCAVFLKMRYCGVRIEDKRCDFNEENCVDRATFVLKMQARQNGAFRCRAR